MTKPLDGATHKTDRTKETHELGDIQWPQITIYNMTDPSDARQQQQEVCHACPLQGTQVLSRVPGVKKKLNEDASRKRSENVIKSCFVILLGEEEESVIHLLADQQI